MNPRIDRRTLARLTMTAACLLVGGACSHETRVAAPSQLAAPKAVTPQAGRVPAGTQLRVSTDQTLGASNQVGDPFSAHVLENVTAPDGSVLVPRGARVHGRVSDIRPAEGEQPASIVLQTESIEFGGARQPLSASIVASTVGGVASGAVIGVPVPGAGAGTVLSLGTDRKTAKIPRDTVLELQLQKPVRSLALVSRRRAG